MYNNVLCLPIYDIPACYLDFNISAARRDELAKRLDSCVKNRRKICALALPYY